MNFWQKIWIAFWRGWPDYVLWALMSLAIMHSLRLLSTLGNLQNSTLRMKHNRGDFEGAAEEFAKWNLSAGKVLPGLVIRRRDERAMYMAKS